MILFFFSEEVLFKEEWLRKTAGSDSLKAALNETDFLHDEAFR